MVNGLKHADKTEAETEAEYAAYISHKGRYRDGHVLFDDCVVRILEEDLDHREVLFGVAE